MRLNNLIVNIYLVSIFSLFLPFAAYVPIFILCSILFIYDVIINHVTVKRNVFFALCVLGLFITATISHFMNLYESDNTQYVKLIITFSFLLGFSFFISKYPKVLLDYRYRIQYLVELIIFFTFIQVILNVYKMSLWEMPITGVQSSVDAYLIIEPPIYFGTKEKNIWATKFVFLSIFYLSCYIYDVFRSKVRFYINILMILFVVVYTFSRTAQLMFISFVFLYYFWKIMYVKDNVIMQVFMFTILFSLSIPMGLFIYDKLLHITLGVGDGLAARLDIWEALYLHLEHMNIWFGNGMLSAENIILTYTTWINNNFHNVFMNIFADMGILGLSLYILILFLVFSCKNIGKVNSRFTLLCLFTPFLICINSQYLGFDSDVIIYFTLVMLLQYSRLRDYGA